MAKAPRFRKKPVEIEAYHWQQFDEDVLHGRQTSVLENMGWPPWLVEAWREGVLRRNTTDPFAQNKGTLIEASEGSHVLSVDDWLIRGVKKGELYRCEPDIFEWDYEEVIDGEDD